MQTYFIWERLIRVTHLCTVTDARELTPFGRNSIRRPIGLWWHTVAPPKVHLPGRRSKFRRTQKDSSDSWICSYSFFPENVHLRQTHNTKAASFVLLYLTLQDIVYLYMLPTFDQREGISFQPAPASVTLFLFKTFTCETHSPWYLQTRKTPDYFIQSPLRQTIGLHACISVTCQWCKREILE